MSKVNTSSVHQQEGTSTRHLKLEEAAQWQETQRQKTISPTVLLLTYCLDSLRKGHLGMVRHIFNAL